MTKSILAAFAVLLLAGSAQALTLTNSDAQAYSLHVTERDSDGSSMMNRTIMIEPGATLDICDSGCMIGLENGHSRQFEGTEAVILKDGGFTIDS